MLVFVVLILIWLYIFLSFNFTFRSSAEEAVQRLHGTVIGQQVVRLSWGRSPTNKQVLQMEPKRLSDLYFESIIILANAD